MEAAALSENSFPHSVHLIKAILISSFLQFFIETSDILTLNALKMHLVSLFYHFSLTFSTLKVE